MALTMPKIRRASRDWKVTSIPAESFMSFGLGTEALKIFDHGTKGRLWSLPSAASGARNWRCNNHEDCGFRVQLRQVDPFDFKFFTSGEHTKTFKKRKRKNSAFDQDQVRIRLCIPRIRPRIRLRIRPRTRPRFRKYPPTYPLTYPLTYPHVYTGGQCQVCY